MPLSEADPRAKLIDPALHACGWTKDLIRREETAGLLQRALFLCDRDELQGQGLAAMQNVFGADTEVCDKPIFLR